MKKEPQSIFFKIGIPSDSWYRQEALNARATFAAQKADQYPFIWFHDVFSLASCLDLLGSRQQVILQPHCPELPSEELVKIANGGQDLAWLRKAEKLAFLRADRCVLPVPSVRPIYSSVLPLDKPVDYILSGCRPAKARFVPPLDPSLVYYLYIGRRLPIKGFELVVEAFKRAHAADPSLRLIVVGRGEPISHPGVVDIGFSEEPASWYAACDYFISPNRQSYFDLSPMEALSLGTPIMLTATGGHDYYAAHASSAIITVGLPDVDLLSSAIRANRRKRSEQADACRANERLYWETFSSEKYRARVETWLRALVATSCK